ncbi:UNVERIFIED_CONTAM: hypothetical protein Slati_1264100 [Sesamum latifolium]|uniref:Uncharacterized protein n=1 Tax=Sesamum latifolium TaxID=2727402 RepID=A0AAW2XFE1_9LAMI
MVYKSVKKNMSRRHYECLSSGAAQQTTYNKPNHHHHHHYFNINNNDDCSGLHGAHHHRRYNSVHVVEEGKAAPPATPKQLVRFGSHKMFSCVTGGA